VLVFAILSRRRRRRRRGRGGGVGMQEGGLVGCRH